MKIASKWKRAPRRSKASNLVTAADRCRDRRDWIRARDLYAVALETDSSLSHIWVQYGHALKESGDPVSALEAYKSSLRVQPNNADTLLQLGHCAKILGNLASATDYYLRALQVDPWEHNAEHELRHLGVDVTTAIPDLNKRREPQHTYSLSEKRIFYFSDTASEEHEFAYEFFSQLAGDVGICQRSDFGRLVTRQRAHNMSKVVPESQPDVPVGSVIVIRLDAWLNDGDLGAIMLRQMVERDIIPVLLIDKVMGKMTAGAYLLQRATQYLAARSCSRLTIAIDGATTATLDSVAGISKYNLSPVRECGRWKQKPAPESGGTGEPIIVARSPNSKQFRILLKYLTANPSARWRVLFEECQLAASRFHEECISLLPTGPTTGVSAFSDASAVVVTDDCVNGAQWMVAALSANAPLICGLSVSAFRIWGTEVREYIDYSEEGSISRIFSNLTSALPTSNAKAAVTPQSPESRWVREDLARWSWKAPIGVGSLQFGRFYSFKRDGVGDLQHTESAEVFRYGSVDHAPKASGHTATTKVHMFAAQMAERSGNRQSIRMLVRSRSEDSDISVRWLSNSGIETVTLRPGQQIWMALQPVALEKPNFFTFSFESCADHADLVLVGFVAVRSEEDSSWSGFLSHAFGSTDTFLAESLI